jgi:hypothetical protein
MVLIVAEREIVKADYVALLNCCFNYVHLSFGERVCDHLGMMAAGKSICVVV